MSTFPCLGDILLVEHVSPPVHPPLLPARPVPSLAAADDFYFMQQRLVLRPDWEEDSQIRQFFGKY